MIEFMPESSGRVLGIRARGKLTDADYKRTLIPELESRFARHEKVAMLLLLDETFQGWDWNAAWDDACFGLKHRADFDRVAVVGGPGWLELCVRIGGFLMKGEIRIFPRDQLQAAWGWIKGSVNL
jgi:hypothetical protein